MLIYRQSRSISRHFLATQHEFIFTRMHDVWPLYMRQKWSISDLQAKNSQEYIQLSDNMFLFFKNASSALEWVNLIFFSRSKMNKKWQGALIWYSFCNDPLMLTPEASIFSRYILGGNHMTLSSKIFAWIYSLWNFFQIKPRRSKAE